ncbi:MAG TPA: histidine phosphatase family protein [Bacteroidales bacterium]|nr:histidine phosphatase family protein [Bacteroidales bacterium]HRS19799.1 histidine phosphatase family protein [Bacteroidales bacterium]
MSIVTTLSLIRHGQTDWNAVGKLQGREDIPLNDFGREQAKKLAHYFSLQQWDCIVTSPLQRAFETARIISNSLQNIQIHTNALLVERCWGQASGLTYEQRKETFPDGIIPQQEEFEPLQQRAMQAMNDIIRQHEGKHVIVVSHGALINAVLHAVSHGEFGSFKTRLANACISILQYNNSSWNVLFYNKTVDELL